jgi:hypothetical protein
MSEYLNALDADVEHAIVKLESHIEQERYRGYDPYDVLTSPLFKLPGLRSNKVIRFGVQQVFRRIPLNLRPLLGIQKGYNPVTLGLCIQAYSYLWSVWQSKRSFYEEQIDYLIDELLRLPSQGFHGTCWGYDFDWQGRYATIPAFMPTVVATGIITNSLFENYKLTGNPRAFESCWNAVGFVRNDLNRTYDGETFCFSYSPNDRQCVFNASMKGARLLSQVYSVTKDPELLADARCAVQYVLKHQRKDGSWAYSHGDVRTWSDGYHTAYVLDCLHAYREMTGDASVELASVKGFNFYKENFYIDEMIPKYYNTKVYPLDATCAAQGILTLTRFGEIERAGRVCGWVLRTLVDCSGFVYYQKHRFYTHRTPYMRWSNAWMFCALAYFLYHRQGLRK